MFLFPFVYFLLFSFFIVWVISIPGMVLGFLLDCVRFILGGGVANVSFGMAPADMMRTDAGRMSWYPSRHGGCWFRKMSCMPPGGFAVWVISSVASLSRVCFVLLV